MHVHTHWNFCKPMITTGINKAKSHNITELRKVSPIPPKTNEDENKITCVHAYNPDHPNIFRAVQDSRSIWKGVLP